MSGEIMSVRLKGNNADLIADCATLGYLKPTDRVLDCTWGEGNFWNKWQPTDGELVGSDIVPEKSPIGHAVDFTALPFDEGSFDVVVFDPPYKLNGTPTPSVDERYGVAAVATRAERTDTIAAGLAEAARVARRAVLVKVQDQVNGGKVRWQTYDVIHQMLGYGFSLVDRLDLWSYRPQPAGRAQCHARRCTSALLVFDVTR